jgi:transposase
MWLGRRSTAPVANMSRSFFLSKADSSVRLPERHGGRKRSVSLREILNGIFYVLSTGFQWQALPKDPPPETTVHHYFMLWDWDGTLERIHYALYAAVGEQAGREVSPTTATIDSQSAKGAQRVGPRSIRRALMRERKSKVASGTFSSVPSAKEAVPPASIQDREHCAGAQPLHASAVSRISSASTVTAVVEGRRPRKPPREQVDGGSRSSNVLLPPSVLKFSLPPSSELRRLSIMLRRLTNPCHST